MTARYEREIIANLERSEQSIQAAQMLAAAGYSDFAASRAYYAAFYAATAALLHEGFEFSKHSGVIAYVHRQFVRTGRLAKQCGQDLNWLFELRSIGDYGEIRHVASEEADKAIQAATAFLQAIKGMLGKQ